MQPISVVLHYGICISTGSSSSGSLSSKIFNLITHVKEGKVTGLKYEKSKHGSDGYLLSTVSANIDDICDWDFAEQLNKKFSKDEYEKFKEKINELLAMFELFEFSDGPVTPYVFAFKTNL